MEHFHWGRLFYTVWACGMPQLTCLADCFLLRQAALFLSLASCVKSQPQFKNQIIQVHLVEMLGKVTRGRKGMKLLHDMTKGKDYGRLKDLVSSVSRWRQDSK